MSSKQYTLRALVFLMAVLILIFMHSYGHMKKNIEVSCINTKSKNLLPFTNKLLPTGSYISNSELYEFIDNYLYLRYSEDIADYYIDPTNQNVAQSENYLKAMNFSAGEEKEVIKHKFVNSSNRFLFLKKHSYATKVRLHAIEYIKSNPVNGFFKVGLLMERFAVSGDTNPIIEGHYKVELTLVSATPLKDTKGRYLNRYGLYVAEIAKYPITTNEFRESMKRFSKKYMHLGL